MLALQVTNHFDIYVLNDISREAVQVLAARVQALGIQGLSLFEIDLEDKDALAQARAIGELAAPFGPKVVITRGNANDAPLFVQALLPRVRRRYMLSIIDPPSACFHWQAFEALALGQRSFDALVLFPDAMDLQRGLSYYLNHEKAGRKLDDFFGTTNWRAVARANPQHAEADLQRFYESRMETLLSLKLGHVKGVGFNRRPLYHLVFGSKHQLGVNLWNSINQRTPYEQDELFLGV